MTFEEFKVWWDAFQNLELGVGGTARNPGAGSLAALVRDAGGDIRTLMGLDFAVEGAALNCLDRTTLVYAQARTDLIQAVSKAKDYVAQYLKAERVRHEYETALDELLITL